MIYLTPTPIGNLDDITIRGIKVLSKAKVILCEDGKITSKLLGLLKIDNKPKYINLVRNNKFNESGIRLALSEIYGKQFLESVTATTASPQNNKTEAGNSPREGEGTARFPCDILSVGWQPKVDGVFKNDETQNGDTKTTFTKDNPTLSNTGTGSFAPLKMTKVIAHPITIQNSTNLDLDQNVIAIVTDAGTPGISDPAFEIIQLLQQLNLDYTVLPGATACIPAIVTSNLVSKEFIFLGFLPLKKGRQTIWSEIKTSKYPVVIYESCHRIGKFIEEASHYLEPQSQISISQELSKKHENTWIGEVNQLKEYTAKDKGEFVIVIKS